LTVAYCLTTQIILYMKSDRYIKITSQSDPNYASEKGNYVVIQCRFEAYTDCSQTVAEIWRLAQTLEPFGCGSYADRAALAHTRVWGSISTEPPALKLLFLLT
jgi:hypothetical protein